MKITFEIDGSQKDWFEKAFIKKSGNKSLDEYAKKLFVSGLEEEIKDFE